MYLGNIGNKIEFIVRKAEANLHKNTDKLVERLAQDACDPVHSVAKRSADVSDDTGSQSPIGNTAYVFGASEGELTLVGSMIERDYHHAIGF